MPRPPQAPESKNTHGAEAEAAKAARRRELLNASNVRKKLEEIRRPLGITPVAVRYASRSDDAKDWKRPDASLSIVNLILAAVEDGRDRSMLSWPERCCDGSVAVALALREAEASARYSYCTLGMWPWRARTETSEGSMAPTLGYLVDPVSLQALGRQLASGQLNNSICGNDGLEHYTAARVSMLVSALLESEGGRKSNESPSLRETTIAFSWDPGILDSKARLPGKGSYKPEPDQILRRVIRFTRARPNKKNGDTLAQHFPKLGDPSHAPHCVFGLPLSDKADLQKILISTRRFAERGLDAVVINLHSNILRPIRDTWEQGLSDLLVSLASVPGRRPPVIMFSNDVHALRKAEGMLKAHNVKLGRPAHLRQAIYSPKHDPLGPRHAIPEGGVSVYDADIKDATLTPLRRSVLDIGRRLREATILDGYRTARRALDALHRAASMPLGLAEAEQSAKMLWEEDSDENREVLKTFHSKQEIYALTATCSKSGVAVGQAEQFRDTALKRLQEWQTDTPVSHTLRKLLAKNEWNRQDTLISFPRSEIALLFSTAAEVTSLGIPTCHHKELAEKIGPGRLIIVGPDTNAIHTILASNVAPQRVAIIGDCAGIGLVSSLLRCLSDADGLGAISARAKLLAAKLQGGGADASLDLLEAQFTTSSSSGPRLLDFTQSRDGSKGKVTVVTTSASPPREIRYRSSAKVPVYTPDEIRQFKNVEARYLKDGDLIPILADDVRARIRTAMQASSKTRALIKGYHTLIAKKRSSLPGTEMAEKARHVLALMRGIDPEKIGADEDLNIRRWLKAGMDGLSAEERVRPDAPRDWERFRIFMQALGTAETEARMFWDLSIMATRSFSIQEGAIFHEQMAAFIVDPEGAAHLTGTTSAESLFDSIRNSVEIITDVKNLRENSQ